MCIYRKENEASIDRETIPWQPEKPKKRSLLKPPAARRIKGGQAALQPAGQPARQVFQSKMRIPKGRPTGLHKDFAKILIDFIKNGSHMGTQGSPKRQPIFQFWGLFWEGSWAIVPASRRGDPGRSGGPDEPKFGRGPGDGKIDKSIVFVLHFV